MCVWHSAGKASHLRLIFPPYCIELVTPSTAQPACREWASCAVPHSLQCPTPCSAPLPTPCSAPLPAVPHSLQAGCAVPCREWGTAQLGCREWGTAGRQEGNGAGRQAAQPGCREWSEWADAIGHWCHLTCSSTFLKFPWQFFLVCLSKLLHNTSINIPHMQH